MNRRGMFWRKRAVLMVLLECDLQKAEALLAENNGFIAKALANAER